MFYRLIIESWMLGFFDHTGIGTISIDRNDMKVFYWIFCVLFYINSFLKNQGYLAELLDFLR